MPAPRIRRHTSRRLTIAELEMLSRGMLPLGGRAFNSFGRFDRMRSPEIPATLDLMREAYLAHADEVLDYQEQCGRDGLPFAESLLSGPPYDDVWLPPGYLLADLSDPNDEGSDKCHPRD